MTEDDPVVQWLLEGDPAIRWQVLRRYDAFAHSDSGRVAG